MSFILFHFHTIFSMYFILSFLLCAAVSRVGAAVSGAGVSGDDVGERCWT